MSDTINSNWYTSMTRNNSCHQGITPVNLACMFADDEGVQESQQRLLEEIVDAKGNTKLTKREKQQLADNCRAEIEHILKNALQKVDFSVIAEHLASFTLERLQEELGE